MRRNKPAERTLTAQEFINIEDIAEDILYTSGKYLFAFLQVKGRDNGLLEEADHERITDQMTQALSDETEPWQLISIPRTVDTRGMIAELSQLRRQTDNAARLTLLSGEIAALEALASEGAKEPMLIIKLWKKAALNADRELKERQVKFRQKLESNQITAVPLHDGDILQLCRICADPGSWQQPEEEPEDVPYLKGKKRGFTLRGEDAAEARRRELLNQVTPAGGLFFQPGRLWIGSAAARVCGVTRFPAEVDYNWAAPLFSATDCVTCLTWYPGQEAEIGDALSRAIGQAKRNARDEHDARKRKAQERQADSGDRLIDDLDGKGKSIGHVSLLCMPFARDEEQLEAVTQTVQRRFLGKRMRLKPLTCLQKEAFQTLSPYYPTDPQVDGMLKRIVPLETVMGGYPMTASLIRDDHGLYFARTPDGGLLSLDILYRGGDRTNGSGIVTGIPGTGKSTMLKHLLESAYMRGLSCIVIDPEREYRDLCLALDGAWLDAGGGTAKVNLLEPLDCAPEKDRDGNPVGAAAPMQLHIQQALDIIRDKLPGLTDLQAGLLKREMRGLYGDRGVSLDASMEDLRSRSHGDWPVMADLYDRLLRRAAEDPRYEDLVILLEDMAIGADAGIWNGHTNIEIRNPMVVIDTKSLYVSSDENKRAQYRNLMRLVTSIVMEDRDTRYVVVADEAQTLVNPEMPRTAEAAANMAKRIRKYEGCLWMGIHSVHEFLGTAVRRWGQDILDAPTYKILFGTDGKNLQDTVDLYRLTPAESKVLEARQRGKALALIGAQHIQVEFELPPYKLELMGNGGGR